MAEVDNEDIEKLREQIRALTKEVGSLKKKLSTEKEIWAKSIFTMKVTLPGTETMKIPLESLPIEMCGMEVKLFGNFLLNNEGKRLLYVWFELSSPTPHNAVLVAKVTYKVPDNMSTLLDEPVQYDFIQVGNGNLSRTACIPALRLGNVQDYNARVITVNVHAKLIRTVRESTVSFDNEDEIANVKVEDETIPVNISYLSAWSEFFSGYFVSDMKESIDGVYPIEDCTAAEFREMLDVIYPSCKPINQWNAESLLQLADRFIMPSLSRNCEVFLTNRPKHNFNDAELLKLSDEYRLSFMQAIVLECTSADQLHKNVIAKDDFKSYSEELKKAIDTRYVESKVPERNKC